MDVQETPVRFPNGAEGSYVRVNAGKFGGVCIPRHVHRGIAYYGLVRQYRFSIDQETLEFPGGFTADGEDVEAVREMVEETGIHEHGKPIHLGVVHADPGLLASENHIWLVTVFARGDDDHVEAETGAETVWVTGGELDGLIGRGGVTSGLTLAALSLLRASSYAVSPETVL